MAGLSALIFRSRGSTQVASPGATVVAIQLHPARIALVLWSATAAVAGLGLLRQIYVYSFGEHTALRALRVFNLDGELTLPAWYSSMLMWTVAALLALHALCAASAQPSTRRYWWALAAIFAYLSLDETVNLHELAGRLLPNDIHYPPIFGFRWVLAFAPLLVLGGLAFLPFLFRLPRDIARRMVVSGAVYVGGAYGMELVGGYIASTSGMHGRSYLAEVVVEETLEMVGLTLFVLVLIDLLVLQARNFVAAPEGREHSG